MLGRSAIRGWLIGLCLLASGLAAAGQAVAPKPEPQATPAQEQAKPALWRVKGAPGTVYLFGTVHVMKKGVDWETPRIKDALKASDTLYLEITEIDSAGIQQVQPIVMQMGLDQEHPLSTKLTKEDLATLDAAVKKLGLPGEAALEQMKPWLVYATLAMLPAMRAGYETSSGIDPTLMAEAKAMGKPVRGLETAEGQVRVLAALSDEEQVKLLHQELEDLPKSEEQLNEIVRDWTHGDVEKIAKLENDEIKVKSPEVYQKMLVQRNEGFARKLVTMLGDPGTKVVFVAIGAAHLAGPDSVMKMLEAKGYTPERIQ